MHVVYEIRNTANGKTYIGSTVYAKYRFQNHRAALRTGKHPNPLLRADSLVYGPDVFVFSILEEIPAIRSIWRLPVREIEKRYIRERQPEYNQYSSPRGA